MNDAKMYFRFDDEPELLTANQVMKKLGRFTSHFYDAKEQIIDGHKIKLVKKATYDIYVNGQLVREGVDRVGDALEELGYHSRYYHARSKNGLYIKRRWLIYDGKERSEKVQSNLL